MKLYIKECVTFNLKYLLPDTQNCVYSQNKVLCFKCFLCLWWTSILSKSNLRICSMICQFLFMVITLLVFLLFFCRIFMTVISALQTSMPVYPNSFLHWTQFITWLLLCHLSCYILPIHLQYPFWYLLGPSNFFRSRYMSIPD